MKYKWNGSNSYFKTDTIFYIDSVDVAMQLINTVHRKIQK